MRARRMSLALLLCAAYAAPAGASELSTSVDGDESNRETLYIAYAADPGEANRVAATYDSAARRFTLTDTGVAAIRPPAASLVNPLGLYSTCQYQGNRVTCDVSQEAIEIEIDLGDLADTASLRSSEGRFQAVGGDGHDTITHAGLGGATLSGDAGDDVLTKTGRGGVSLDGGPGGDVLRAGDGGSQLVGGAGPDRLEGGAGHDDVDYSGWTDLASDPSPDGTTGVRVSFDGLANDGMPGEGDDVSDAVERVDGSRYADVLVGDERAQQLEGDSGDDVVDGAGGDDVLVGEHGNDHLTGGPGVDWVYGGQDFVMDVQPDDDVVDTADGTFDRYACGAGSDVVTADAQDVWAYPYESWRHPTVAECETVTVLP